ncbi:MAG TPA: hypothetical protein VJ890_10190 [Vineibacter sp.]|nr:hypothetical protein [Vineibacter sp.]
MILPRRRVLLGASAAAVALACPPAAARQLSFERSRGSSHTHYRVRWLDHGQRERDISFYLETGEIDAATKLFREFSLEAMRDYMQDALRQTAARWPQVKLEFEPRAVTAHGMGLAYRISGPQHMLAEASDQLKRTMDESKVRYVAGVLRRIDGNTITVDYIAATRRYVRALAPLAQALSDAASGADDRGRLGLALSFFQAIPYDTLSNRVRDGGYDFAPPPTLLDMNRGDCDSKSVALACVLRGLTPYRMSAMATMPGHAILAVDVGWRDGDAWVRRDGRVFIAMEPAGPAVVPVGKVARETGRFLDQQRFYVWPLSA